MSVALEGIKSNMHIAVVSVMGIEASGLALAALRYAAVLNGVGVPATAFIVSSVDHAEYRNAVRIRSLAELPRAIMDVLPSHLFWVGLHTDDSCLDEQLNLLYQAASSVPGGSVVVPERTLLESRRAYGRFLDALADDCVASLVVFNFEQRRIWTRWQDSVAIRVVPPPIPREFFALRQARRQRRSTAQFNLVSLGRVSRRKGTDRLLAMWPTIRQELLALGLDPRLTLVGESYDQESDLREMLEAATVQCSSVSWVNSFAEDPRAGSILLSDVGVALSTQEFDAIALSEFMAAGVPVVATPTLGHRAIHLEAPAVAIAGSDTEVLEAVRHLAMSAGVRAQIGDQLSDCMARSRSAEVVGPALRSALLGERS